MERQALVAMGGPHLCRAPTLNSFGKADPRFWRRVLRMAELALGVALHEPQGLQIGVIDTHPRLGGD